MTRRSQRPVGLPLPDRCFSGQSAPFQLSARVRAVGTACELRKATSWPRFLALSNAQLIGVGTSTGHRLPVTFTAAQRAAIADRAAARGQSLSTTVRQLVAAALTFDTEPGPRPDSPATLAALVAAEHAALMVAAVLPDGEHRWRETAAQAAVAAEERLAMFREADR